MVTNRKSFQFFLAAMSVFIFFSDSNADPTIIQNGTGLGINVPAPAQLLHMGDGNFLIEGGGETAIIMKRHAIWSGGPSGTTQNPIFKIGRIIQAGDGDPEFRFLFEDDFTEEHSVFEFDRKGIIASVKPDNGSLGQSVGSHFEGFIEDYEWPFFRLNSYPRMRLEMGDGINQTDVAVERSDTGGLSFYTNSTQQVTIDSDGDVGIGTDAPDYELHVIGDIALTGEIYQLSDFKSKMDVEKIDNALEKIASIRGVTYKKKGQSDDRRSVGVIAQELEAVLPELVSEDASGVKSVNYSKLACLLIEAVKEQNSRIDEMSEQLAELRNSARH